MWNAVFIVHHWNPYKNAQFADQVPTMKRLLLRIDVAFGAVAAYAIRELWQRRVGAQFNKRRRIDCRFYPSCSEFARHVFQSQGLFRGWKSALQRIGRCSTHNTDSCLDYPQGWQKRDLE